VLVVASALNPIQQGLKHLGTAQHPATSSLPQRLIQYNKDWNLLGGRSNGSTTIASALNPIQQGLKRWIRVGGRGRRVMPQRLIQYNKDWNPS